MVRICIVSFLLLISSFALGADFDGTIMYDVPSYKGNMQRFLKDHIIYPDSAKINRIECCVFVEFDVDSLGNTINHRIKYGVRKDFDKEAIRVASLLKFNPLKKEGNNKIFKNYIIRVEFKLPKNNEK